MPDRRSGPRLRLSKPARHAQLLEVARDLIRDEGTDALTLARVAERADVTKPLVYNHFGDRAGLLAALHREFDARQHQVLDDALANAADDVDAVVQVVAGAYIECSIAAGRELADVVAALSGSPTLERLRRDTIDAYIAKCREALAPYVRTDALGPGAFQAILGAADALVRASITNETSSEQATATLSRIIAAVIADSEGP